jgi:predicted NBD/HSP70 family sugar kinase
MRASTLDCCASARSRPQTWTSGWTTRPTGRRFGELWGTALAGVLDLLDVDTVVLGGGYATLAPWLVPAVTAQLRERVPAVGAREVRVMAGRLGPGAATLGAATSVVRPVIADPAALLA